MLRFDYSKAKEFISDEEISAMEAVYILLFVPFTIAIILPINWKITEKKLRRYKRNHSICHDSFCLLFMRTAPAV